MRASEVLQRCLSPVFASIHASRIRTVLLAVDALIQGRRLVLIDLARSWPGAQRIRAPLKRLDRLLGNERLHADREAIYGAMAHHFLRDPQPLILVDWCRLHSHGRWHLLRAAVPVGGRSVTVLDMVFPQRLQGSPQAERRFLKRLQALVPAGVKPILITDAGYRAPWCRAVTAMGWDWITRIRNRTRVKPSTAPDRAEEWLPSKALYELVVGAPRNLGLFDVVQSRPLTARLVLHARMPRGRHHRRLNGQRARCKNSLSAARREREPWILACSPGLKITAAQAVQCYARRMQIELAFRDLKSHRYGHAYEDSLTRKPKRIEVLLLLHALALFAAWLTGVLAHREGLMERLAPQRNGRLRYSLVRLGWEALARRWLNLTSDALLSMLGAPPERVRQNWALET